MLEWWREQIMLALPLHLILPIIIVMSGLYIGADYFYTAYKESQVSEVIQEVADEVKAFGVISWQEVQDEPVQLSEVLHTVGQEPSRVQHI
tara:strand:+ start:8197 stop:8469 length:273 start_codon:yes stop_codon:yes gene_type:complete